MWEFSAIAAELPNKALDQSTLRNRREVYCLELKEEAHDSEISVSISVDTEETIPFIPEICFIGYSQSVFVWERLYCNDFIVFFSRVSSPGKCSWRFCCEGFFFDRGKCI